MLCKKIGYWISALRLWEADSTMVEICCRLVSNYAPPFRPIIAKISPQFAWIWVLTHLSRRSQLCCSTETLEVQKNRRSQSWAIQHAPLLSKLSRIDEPVLSWESTLECAFLFSMNNSTVYEGQERKAQSMWKLNHIQGFARKKPSPPNAFVQKSLKFLPISPGSMFLAVEVQ